MKKNNVNRRRFKPRGMVFFLLALSAWCSTSVSAEQWNFSGLFTSTVAGSVGPDYPGTGVQGTGGMEEYANLRLTIPSGERGTVFAAVNLIAASGTYVPVSGTALASSFVSGPGYSAAMEVERLYYRIESDAFDQQVGLLRIPFGYGQAWKPSDFLASPNPLNPNARSRGSLGAVFLAYPSDTVEAEAFIAAGPDSTALRGEGALGGTMLEYHGSVGSVQGLYALQAPPKGARWPVHRFGFSGKIDAGLSVVLDALYVLDGNVIASGYYYDKPWNGFQGLNAALGIDYSFMDGKMYAVLQYLYNGGGALNPGEDLDALYSGAPNVWSGTPPAQRSLRTDIPVGPLNRKNYLYQGTTYSYDDYTRWTFSWILCADDLSLLPSLAYEQEPFQGCTVDITVRFPLDLHTFNQGLWYGELGPVFQGESADLALLVTLRL